MWHDVALFEGSLERRIRGYPSRPPGPDRPGQPCPPGIAAIKLTIAETARLARLARQHVAGLVSDARLAFHLRWSRWRRQHQARAAGTTTPPASPQPPR
jgi:hypothetical protein